MVKGTTQDVAVTSAPVEGADCTLQNTKGVWHLTTPGSARVHKDMHSLTITCTKPGYQDAIDIVHPKFQAWTLAGGAIGLGVDASTGAMAEYAPDQTVEMTPATGASAPPAATQAPPAAAPSVRPTS
jgi:hypothetical protein